MLANILLILGLAAVVAPLLVSPQLLRREVPMMIGVSLLLWLLAADGNISRFDGSVLLAMLVLFLGVTIWANRHGTLPPNGTAPSAATKSNAPTPDLVAIPISPT